MSGPEPLRSAVPLAAGGIACLGLVPTFGSADQPLHWAMTAGMVGFGALLWVRHRLLERNAGRAPSPLRDPRQAGHALLIVTAVIAAMVLVIVGSRWHSGAPIAPLSLAMPLAGLGWLAAIGLKLRRLDETLSESLAPADRLSRRAPKRDSVAPPLSSQGKSPANRHASL